MVIIFYFMFSAYATNAQIGSPSAMYRLLKEAALKRPVAGNQDGSYMTMKSNFALIFGIIQLCSGNEYTKIVRCILLMTIRQRYRLPGSGILAKGYSQPTYYSSQSLYLRWSSLVCDSIWVRYNIGLGCRGPYRQSKLPNISEWHDTSASQRRTVCSLCSNSTFRDWWCSSPLDRIVHGSDIVCFS